LEEARLELVKVPKDWNAKEAEYGLGDFVPFTGEEEN
jgi:hypothetical protein